MKAQQLFTLFALASGATATFDWLDAKKFHCPANEDNHCIDKQKGGFKWEGLSLGKFTKFGDFDFEGYECADSFDGLKKRDMITGRTFQSKCIKGRATEDKTKAPSFGCGSSKQVEKFSVKSFQISVEFDVELEFHYEMANGSVCKQKQHCKKGGTTVNNTQCGGAKTVKVIVPKGKGKDKGPKGGKGCDFGFHHIDFDCLPPKTPPKTTTTTKRSTTPAASTTPISSTTRVLSSTTTPVSSTTTPVLSSTTAPVSSTTTPVLSSTTAPVSSTTTSPSKTEDIPVTSSSSATTSSLGAITTDSSSTTPVASETPSTSSPEATPSTTSNASPISSTVTPPFPVSSSSTTTAPSEPTVTPPTPITETEVIVSTITSCSADVKSCPGRPPVTTTTPSIPVPTTDCPPVLPQCLNTWLFFSECKSNTDVNCFCKSDKFVELIYQCLSAHGVDDEEIDKAQNFFQGICAPHVPENPAIITDATTLTVTATPIITAPVTTIQLLTTVTVPCVETEGPSAGVTIPGSSTVVVISTAVTVPQVVFETITGPATSAVSLVQGTPTAPATNIVSSTGVVVPTTFASVINNSTGTTTGRTPLVTGAASRNGITLGGVLAAGMAAAMML